MPGLVAVNGKCPPETFAHPKRTHELEAGQPFQILGVPFPQLRVLRLLADDRILDDGIAEVIHHRRDSEDAAQPVVQTFFSRGLSLGVCIARAHQSERAAVSASAATALRLVIDAVERCGIAGLLRDGAD